MADFAFASRCIVCSPSSVGSSYFQRQICCKSDSDSGVGSASIFRDIFISAKNCRRSLWPTVGR